MLFLGGDNDRLGLPVNDFVSLRYNRILHRYEFTALVWDIANQEFVTDVTDGSVLSGVRSAPSNGRLSDDLTFDLTIGDETYGVSLSAEDNLVVTAASSPDTSISNAAAGSVAAIQIQLDDAAPVEVQVDYTQFTSIATLVGAVNGFLGTYSLNGLVEASDVGGKLFFTTLTPGST